MHRQPALRLVPATVFLFATVLVFAALPAIGEAPGKLEFKAHNQIYDAHGKFETWSFTEVDIPGGDLTQGTVVMEVDLASVWEKASALADHLRTADFFDVSKYTTATVKLHSAKKTGENTYEGVATVTLHGHTNDVPVAFEVVGTDPLTVKGSATLDRTAFGIGQPYDSSNEKSIVEDVEIFFEAPVSE